LKKIFLILIAILTATAFVSAVPIGCSETDGGRVYDVAGTVTFSRDGNSFCVFADTCVNSSALREFYCVSGAIRYINYNCGSSGCSQGRCLNLPVTNNIGTGNTGSGNNNIGSGNNNVAGSGKSIQTFTIAYGPDSMETDVQKLAKYDLIDTGRIYQDASGKSVRSQIKAINSHAEIYPYQMGPATNSGRDTWNTKDLGSIARYNNARGHSMGSLNGNHPDLFLTDANGARIDDPVDTTPSDHMYLMDFGSPIYQKYWIEATTTDNVNQP